MKTTMWVALLAAVLSGCTTTRDGLRIGFHSPPSASDVDRVRHQVEQNAQSHTAKEVVAGALAPSGKVGLILVGKVGSLKTVAEQDKPQMYANYVKQAALWHPGKPPAVTPEAFRSLAGGTTTVETFSVPVLMGLKFPAMVQSKDLSRIDFPSWFASFQFAITGDLVVARSNDDGLLVIEAVLCKKAATDYDHCAAQYEKGRFDYVTGVEVGRDLKPKEGGARIDPTTYRVLERAQS